MDELTLIQNAKDGDLEAFNHLVLAYQDIAYNVAYRILSDDDAAEDAVQSAFVSAFRSISTFRGGAFRAWILRMVTNACYDDLRRQKRRPTTPLEPDTDDGEDEIESPAWLADNSNSPQEYVETAELEEAVQHCLNELPIEFRVVVVMVDVQGFDYIEAAQTIGTALGTIKSRLARARLRMRDCLQGFWELLPTRFRLEVEDRT